MKQLIHFRLKLTYFKKWQNFRFFKHLNRSPPLLHLNYLVLEDSSALATCSSSDSFTKGALQETRNLCMYFDLINKDVVRIKNHVNH